MSKPKLIKIHSLPKDHQLKQLSQNQLSQRSCVDTVIMGNKSTHSLSYESVLVQQVKKLSKDNDRMWKLLTESQQSQHTECSKIQKKLKQSLQCAQKQASLMKDMYTVEKTNHLNSQLFFEKREEEWQQIVSELKKVIQDYQSTNSIDMYRASQIFNQTTQMKNHQNRFKQQSSINDDYDEQINNKTSRNQRSTVETQQVRELSLKSKQISVTESQINDSQIRYNEHEQEKSQLGEQSGLSYRQKRQHRSKLFRTNNLKSSSSLKSAKKLYEKIYSQQGNNYQNLHSEYEQNPEDIYRGFSLEDVFQRALRKTYSSYRSKKMKLIDILDNPHMLKLKEAKTSTKQRLNKTIRKILLYDSPKQLEDILKFIQEKMYKKYKILKGQNAFMFLKERLIECEQIFQSSNSALDRLDSEPTNFINGVKINSKFQQFQQKKKDLRSLDQRSMPSTKRTPIDGLKDLMIADNRSQGGSSKSGSNIILNINSNIKDKNYMTQQLDNFTRQNNHINTTKDSKKDFALTHRQDSKKNIYTQKRLSRRRNLQNQLSKNQSSMMKSNQPSSERVGLNLSSLIGTALQYDMSPIQYSNNQSLSKNTYPKTTDNSLR